MKNIFLLGMVFFLILIRLSFAQPTYSLDSSNNTISGQPTLFSLNWTSASGYIFSFDNGTGTMINDTFKNFGEINENSVDTIPMNALWHMNGDVSDASGNNNGQMRGTVDCSKPGKFGNACFFDNSPGNYINIGNSTSINFNASANFTWNLWMNRKTATDWDVLMGEFNYGTSGIRLVVNGTVLLLDSNNEGPGTTLKVGTNQWYMITVVYTPTHQSIYINGTNMSISGTGTFVSNSDTNLTIGFSNTAKEQFSGYIDEVAIWNRSLSSKEILELYNNGYSTWSNITKIINPTIGANINWMVYANDSTNNWNTSNAFSFLTTGLPFPQWRNLNQSSSTIAPNGTVVLSAQVYDPGYDNSTADWAILSTNESGSWQNQTWYSPLNLNSYARWLQGDSNKTLDLSVVVDDIDGDGTPEIITCGYYYSITDYATYAQLRIWNYTATSSTSGSLNLESELGWTNGTTYCYSVKVVDLNHDGHKKIITGGSTRGDDLNNADLRIFNYTGGQIKLEAIEDWIDENLSHTVIFTMTTADLNDDGKDEIITGGMYNETDYVSQLRIWNYTGNVIMPVAETHWSVNGRTEIQSVRVADLNNDGQPKIITGGLSTGSLGDRYQAELDIWDFTDGTINLENRTEWYLYNDTIIYSVAAGDLNQDGKLELVTGGLTNDGTERRAQLRVWSYTYPTLNLEDDYTWYVGANDAEIYSVVVQDINKDGIPEIVTAGMQNNVTDYGQVRIWTWVNNKLSLKNSKEWLDAVDKDGILEGELDDSLYVADLDGDGINEIVTGGRLESTPNSSDPSYGILRVYSAGNVYGSPMNLTKIANIWLWSNFTWRNTSIASGAIEWRIYYNNTAGNWNATDISTFSISNTVIPDTVPPTSNCFSNVINNTAVNTGTPIELGCQWNDNVELSMYVSSSEVNSSGSYSNGTWSSFGEGNWSNLTIIFPNEAGSNITLKFYANDSSNNQNVTNVWFWYNNSVSDTMPPTYSNMEGNVSNNTPVNTGTQIDISAQWSDNVALSMYMISNMTNSSDLWNNGTWTPFGGDDWSNFTVIYPTDANGGNILFKIYANDTSDNQNATEIWYWYNTTSVSTPSPTSVRLWLNDNESDYNMTYGGVLNTTATVNVTGLTVTIEENGTVIASGTDTVTNITTLPAGYYNITAYTLGDTDYSFSSTTYFVNVTDTTVYSPNITNVQVVSITTSSATITWSTDIDSNTSIVIPSSATYSNLNDSVQSHSIDVWGLSASNLYVFDVISCDALGNCSSVSSQFITTAPVFNTAGGGGGGGGSPTTSTKQANTTNETTQGTNVYPEPTNVTTEETTQQTQDGQIDGAENKTQTSEIPSISGLSLSLTAFDWVAIITGLILGTVVAFIIKIGMSRRNSKIIRKNPEPKRKR